MTQNILPEDSEARKRIPVCTGLYDYFPAAIEELIRYHRDTKAIERDLSLARCFADRVALLLPWTGKTLPTGERASTILAWQCLEAALALLQMESGEAAWPCPDDSGFVDYFAPVLAAIAELSWAGNDKHNPGQPLHWSRWLSPDHRDCIGRHSFDFAGTGADGMRHCVTTCWRALAVLQLELEAEGAPVARGARVHADPCAELTRLTEEYGGYEAQDEPTRAEKRQLVDYLRKVVGRGEGQYDCCDAVGIQYQPVENWFRRVCRYPRAWTWASVEQEVIVIAALEKDLAQCP